MGRSIQNRIIGPIALLIITGLLAAIWISFAALHSHNTVRSHDENAFRTLQRVKKARQEFRAVNEFVMKILGFNVLKHPDLVQTEFDTALKKLNESIRKLQNETFEKNASGYLSALMEDIRQWTLNASIAVGSIRSNKVPTRYFLRDLSTGIDERLSHIETMAQTVQQKLAGEERSKFTGQLIGAFSIMLVFFLAVAIIALRQANWLARALKNLLDRMQLIGNGEFELKIPYQERGDEIGAMARGVAAFANNFGELTHAKEKIEHMALSDALTDLANRRMLNHYLQSRIGSSATEHRHLALLHVGLDKFKDINDFLGHAAGDRILCEVARVMLENVGPGNLVARIGGDEFVIVIDITSDAADVAGIANHIISEISHPVQMGNCCTKVGASIGIAFSDEAGDNPERLLVNAGIALHEAKSSGKGRYCIYSSETRQRLEQKNALIQELQRAVANREICAFFQPQIDGRNGKLIGFEALARWNHPTKGILSPGHFIDVAFDNGLSESITKIVLEDTLYALKYWRDLALDVKQVSINLSSKQLGDAKFIDHLTKSVESAGLTSSDLAIEVVESVLFGDEFDPIIENLNRLQELGYHIELDDFGTAHASISNLRRFKVNKVKIDKSFVIGVDTNSEQEVMVKSMIELSKNLNIEHIAEGVETESEMSKLLAMGCAQMQGFGICRPLPVDAAARWLYARKPDEPVEKSSLSLRANSRKSMST